MNFSRLLFLCAFAVGPHFTDQPMVEKDSYDAIVLSDSVSPVDPAKQRYYGHDAVVDRFGVIAPWYAKTNGQCDFRMRIAMETLKRYPWTTTKNAAVAYPDYLFTSNWEISGEGTITPRHYGNWSNGDLGQRAYCVLEAMVDYYRYSGDPSAIAHLTYMGDYVLDYGLTPSDHQWPEFPISVPTKGKPYGHASADGMIQLDISAAIGEKLLRGYELTKNQRWLDAVKHWGDLLAEHCDTTGLIPPWPRYANPKMLASQEHPDIKIWDADPDKDLQTGSVVMILDFLDHLIRIGYRGNNGQIEKARNAGIAYLQNILLPEWTVNKNWGCFFWDWVANLQVSSISAYAARYLIRHPEIFPEWRTDARNILMLYLGRVGVDPKSGADAYSGSWAYPESAMCCGRSLFYAPLTAGVVMAEYGVEAKDELLREMGYRQMVLQTYDIHESGVSEDNIDGGIIVNNEWLNIAVPIPLLATLQAISWLPEELGASRENHLVRSTAVINSITYLKNGITYSTFDAPAQTTEILRLSYAPAAVSADGIPMTLRSDLSRNGYTVKRLANGDAIVSIRHDGKKKIRISGKDPQTEVKNNDFRFQGNWEREKTDSSLSGTIYFTEDSAASASTTFVGNQVRVIARVDKAGGQADVFIDNIKQRGIIDFWNPRSRSKQIVFVMNGLGDGKHELKIVARGNANPYSKGKKVYIDALQYSDQSQIAGFPEGTGPTNPQRLIFGYPKRVDYKDSKGHSWRPGAELIARLGKKADPVADGWIPEKQTKIIATPDPELYKYGFHARDFWVNLTTGPGHYDLLLKFFKDQNDLDTKNKFRIMINRDSVLYDLTNTGNTNIADTLFENISPENGIVRVRFTGVDSSEAFVQALELIPKK